MRKILAITLLMTACSTPDVPKREIFSAPVVPDDLWATYESRWATKNGIVRFELSLKNGAFGYDSYYRLVEFYELKNSTQSIVSSGTYTTHYNWKENQHAIILRNLSNSLDGGYLRYQKLGSSQEMYFLTRGSNELLPCDDNFTVLTDDKRYTLHKRSRLFTIEGYITFENDSATFFERNTREHWKVANLGEIQELRKSYFKLAQQKYEGIYVRALAYSVQEELSFDTLDYLVVKWAINIGQDPEVD